MSKENGFSFEQREEEQRRIDRGLQLLSDFVSDDLFIEYGATQPSVIRAKLNRRTHDTSKTYRLEFNEDLEPIEKGYTGLLAYSSILLGMAQENPAIMYPKPITDMLAYTAPEERDLLQLILHMTDTLLDVVDPEEWDETIKEELNKHSKAWRESAEDRAEAIGGIFATDIFQDLITPQFEDLLAQDIRALVESY
jgi:hypothetical protein